MKSYETLAGVYVALHPKEEIFKQQKFFETLITKYTVKTCLDCACGAGWHLYMLADLGLTCAGSDLSPHMLAVAIKNLRGKVVQLKQEDFRSLARSWSTRFDMIICMSTSLPHMLTEVDAVAALTSMYEQLSDQGILVISNGISDALLDAKPRLIPARVLKDQAFYFFIEYPTLERVVFNILHIKKTESGFEHRLEVVENNAMRKATLDRYFAEVPFHEVQYYGDYDFSPYSVKESTRLIAIARR